MSTLPFNFKRDFASKKAMREIETKISVAKTLDIALSCIPSSFPDYIKSELNEQITRFFSK